MKNDDRSSRALDASAITKRSDDDGSGFEQASVSFDSARRDAAHFIDGAFTKGSTGKFWENRTPARQQRDRPRSRGRQGRDRRGGAAPRKAALDGPWGAMTVAERTDLLAAVADGINAPLRRIPRRRVPRHRQALEPRPPSRHPARRRQFQDVRRHGEERLDRDLRHADARRQGRDQLRPAPAQGRDRGDLARGTCRCC